VQGLRFPFAASEESRPFGDFFPISATFAAQEGVGPALGRRLEAEMLPGPSVGHPAPTAGPLHTGAVQLLIDTAVGVFSTRNMAGAGGTAENVAWATDGLAQDVTVHSQTLAHASFVCLPVFRAYTSCLLGWLDTLAGSAAATVPGGASVSDQRDLLVQRLKALAAYSDSTGSALRRICSDLLARERAAEEASDRVAILSEILLTAGCLNPIPGQSTLKRKRKEEHAGDQVSADSPSVEDGSDSSSTSSCF
jgi:hypothetical protein